MLGFGEHAIDLELRFWIKDAHHGIRNVTSEILLEILRLFNERGIEIPLPERNVHVLGPAADEPRGFRAPAPT
jgi:small-conductance mechanosensitive channel